MSHSGELIASLLDAPLRNIASILPGHDGWTDIVHASSAEGTSGAFRPPWGTTVHEFVHRRLGHIVVNRRNYDVLTSSYMYAEDRTLDSSYVNRSLDAAHAFVDELIEIATAEREIAFGPDTMDSAGRGLQTVGRRTTLLHGPRGSGKTFFLNHLLARFSGYFDKRKVIWVRINMVADFDGELLHRIFAQVAKIVLRYYDPKSDLYVDRPLPLPLEDGLRKFIREAPVDSSQRDRYADALLGMFTVFRAMKRDDPLSPSLVPMPLGRQIFKLAQEMGYSFIVVLDGLDKLEASAFHQRRFAAQYTQAIRLARDPARLGMAFVFVTRTNTLHAEVDPGNEGSPFWPSLSSNRRLAPAEFLSILEARERALHKEIRALGSSLPAAERSADWKTHLSEFVNFLWNGKDGDVSYQTILEGFGDNRRAQMQVVQLAYFDFLRRKHERTYLLTESLVKAGQAFPPKPYRYAVGTDGTIERQGGNDTLFDNHLLPSLFWYPCVSPFKRLGHPSPQAPEPPPRSLLLAGIRISQLVMAHEQRIVTSGDIERLMVSEVEDLCVALFGYRRTLVRMILEEFVEFEFCELRSPLFPTPTSADRLQVCPMPKLKKMLGTFIYDIAYLGLWAMRVPLSIDAAEGGEPYFRAVSIDLPTAPQSSPKRDTLTSWVAAKVINAAGLCRLLAVLNEEQRGTFESGLLRLNSRLRTTATIATQHNIPDRIGMFEFTDVMRLAIKKGFQLIEETVPQSIITNEIAAYYRVWSLA